MKKASERTPFSGSTRVLRNEQVMHNVNVNAIAPEHIAT